MPNFERSIAELLLFKKLMPNEIPAPEIRLSEGLLNVMNTTIDTIMPNDYSNRNLQKASFKNENLANTSFLGSDLRGADFSGSDLTGADLTNVKTGITPLNTSLIFLAALVVSMLSGYVAMLAGTTVQGMLTSGDEKIRMAGNASVVIILLTFFYYYLNGGRTVVRNFLLPVIILSVLIGIVAYFSGLGTGRGMLFLVLSLLLVVVMIIVGTVSRASAGVLSCSILFLIVAVVGSIFGKTVGGGIGTVIMAVGCALISKRALSGAKGFESLRKITSIITCKFGTSFRNARLTNANFSESKICNADFTNAELSSVNWGDSKKENCTPLQIRIE
jgi:uncharacterized protein YjbI with pentapeptide repeats